MSPVDCVRDAVFERSVLAIATCGRQSSVLRRPPETARLPARRSAAPRRIGGDVSRPRTEGGTSQRPAGSAAEAAAGGVCHRGRRRRVQTRQKAAAWRRRRLRENVPRNLPELSDVPHLPIAQRSYSVGWLRRRMESDAVASNYAERTPTRLPARVCSSWLVTRTAADTSAYDGLYVRRSASAAKTGRWLCGD